MVSGQMGRSCMLSRFFVVLWVFWFFFLLLLRSRGPLVAVLWSRGLVVRGPLGFAPAVPFYLLLLLACSFVLVRAFASLLLRFSARLLCFLFFFSSALRCSFCLLPLFASLCLLVLASAFPPSASLRLCFALMLLHFSACRLHVAFSTLVLLVLLRFDPVRPSGLILRIPAPKHNIL